MRNHDIKDRGIIKWQGLMLPEHVKLIRELGEEVNYVQQTLLDDWELQQVQEELDIAYKRQSISEVTTWRKGSHTTYTGRISKLNYRLNYLSVEGPFGHDRIPVADIIKVYCVD